MRHCFFHGGGGQELPASSDGDKAESFGQVFPADAAGAPRPGFPGHGKTDREMSKSWSKSPAMNMTPIFATKHEKIYPEYDSPVKAFFRELIFKIDREILLEYY